MVYGYMVSLTQEVICDKGRKIANKKKYLCTYMSFKTKVNLFPLFNLSLQFSSVDIFVYMPIYVCT